MKDNVTKLIKRGFSYDEWKKFPIEVKENDLIIAELFKRYTGDAMRAEIIKEAPKSIALIDDPQKIRLFLNKDNFKYISYDEQVKFVKEKEELVAVASDEIQRKYIPHHPHTFALLSEEDKIKLLADAIDLLAEASESVQFDFIKEDKRNIEFASPRVQCMVIKNNPNLYEYCSLEVKRDILKLSHMNPELISANTINRMLMIQGGKITREELSDYLKVLRKTKRKDRAEVVSRVELILSMDTLRRGRIG